MDNDMILRLVLLGVLMTVVVLAFALDDDRSPRPTIKIPLSMDS